MTEWTRQDVENLLMASDKAVGKALVQLFDRQTTEEQMTDSTRNHNCRGFTPLDAEIFSSFAKRVIGGRPLTTRQLACCRKPFRKSTTKLGKYANQLLEVIEEREGRGEVIPVPKSIRSEELNSVEEDWLVQFDAQAA